MQADWACLSSTDEPGGKKKGPLLPPEASLGTDLRIRFAHIKILWADEHREVLALTLTLTLTLTVTLTLTYRCGVM